MNTLGSREEQRAGPGTSSDAFLPYADVRETHSAVVVLLGDRAYKLKKPVDLGFLDFSTRDKRRQACERELELNRRIAPDVYLGISQVDGVDGETVEHLLTMRRMPAERRLAHLVRTGADLTGELRDIAAIVARFHERAERSPRIARYGGREAVAQRWSDNVAGMRPYVGTWIDPEIYEDVQLRVSRYLAGREPLFDSRMAAGFVLDGHGDLLAEDVFCLADGIRILDCIDFDDELRYLDRIDDVACLAMDLERLGSAQAAWDFLDAYRSESGDPAPPSLVHHYIGYRAFMRAKVGCLPGAAEHGVLQVSALLELARRHLADTRVQLVLVGGSPGTGKTTTAEAGGQALGWTVLSSDRVRKELAGVPPETPMAAEFEHDLYRREWTERTYAELAVRAERCLGMGESVIVDATWSDPQHRNAMEALARRTAADLASFRCVVPDDLADARIGRRQSFSDADEAIAARIRERFSPWPEAICVDATQPVDAAVAHLVHRLRPWETTRTIPRPRIAPD